MTKRNIEMKNDGNSKNESHGNSRNESQTVYEQKLASS